ncbi:MAG: CRISPR-associated endonuclease Cas2 [Thiohalorhabdaceae bacterium]
MARKTWHIVAYDVRDPRRLQRVHRFLRKRGLAAQESVFLVKAGNRQLQDLLNGLGGIIDRRRDDVRTYPVAHPGALWLSGPNPLAHLHQGGTSEGRRRPPGKGRKALPGPIARLLKRGGSHD